MNTDKLLTFKNMFWRNQIMVIAAKKIKQSEQLTQEEAIKQEFSELIEAISESIMKELYYSEMKKLYAKYEATNLVLDKNIKSIQQETVKMVEYNKVSLKLQQEMEKQNENLVKVATVVDQSYDELKNKLLQENSKLINDHINKVQKINDIEKSKFIKDISKTIKTDSYNSLKAFTESVNNLDINLVVKKVVSVENYVARMEKLIQNSDKNIEKIISEFQMNTDKRLQEIDSKVNKSLNENILTIEDKLNLLDSKNKKSLTDTVHPKLEKINSSISEISFELTQNILSVNKLVGFSILISILGLIF